MRGWGMAVLISVVSLAGCQRGPDVEKIADGALQSAALDHKVDAKYDQEAKVVHLSGTVTAAADRDRANDVVRASIGNLAEVANEIVVEGIDEKTAADFDTAIKNRFDTTRDENLELKDYEVDAAVENGVVTLTGEVASAAEKTKIEAMARNVPGVKDVVNSIVVDPKVRPRRPTAR